MDEKETQLGEGYLFWSQVCLLQQKWRMDQNGSSSSLVREKANGNKKGRNEKCRVRMECVVM